MAVKGLMFNLNAIRVAKIYSTKKMRVLIAKLYAELVKASEASRSE